MNNCAECGKPIAVLSEEVRHRRDLVDALEAITRAMQIAHEFLERTFYDELLLEVEELDTTDTEIATAIEHTAYFLDRLREHVAKLEDISNDESAYHAVKRNEWEAATRDVSQRPKAQPAHHSDKAKMCVECGRRYESSWPNQLYCSHRCRNACRVKKAEARRTASESLNGGAT